MHIALLTLEKSEEFGWEVLLYAPLTLHCLNITRQAGPCVCMVAEAAC